MCAHVVSCSPLRRSQDYFWRPKIKRFFRKQIFSKEISINLQFSLFSELLVPDSNENDCSTGQKKIESHCVDSFKPNAPQARFSVTEF